MLEFMEMEFSTSEENMEHACCSSSLLYKHPEKYCRRRYCSEQGDATTYTLVSSILDFSLLNWSPVYGDMLSCIRMDDFVAVMFINQVVGRIPEHLAKTFLWFLEKGTIHVRIAGALTGCGYGMKIPVDYIFKGDNLHLSRLVDDLKGNQVKVEESLPHTPSRIPPTDKRKYPQKRCVHCKKHGINRDTRYYCNDCNDFPALCKACFRDYHL